MIVVILLLAGCSKEPIPRSHKEQMTEDLCQYHDAVTEGWAYLESKRTYQGVDVTAIRDRLLARVTEETTPEQFAVLLQEFAAALKEGHSQAYTSQLRAPFSNTWPVGFVLVKDGIVVGNLNWLRDNPGIELGDRLIRVDGQPIEDFIRQRMELTSASTDLARRVLSVDQMHWTDAAKVRLSFERIDGKFLDAEFVCLPQRVDYRYRERKEFCSYTQVDENIGMIRIPQFTWNETQFQAASNDRERDTALTESKQQIDRAFEEARDTKGLILDLRGNSGGFELLSSYVAEHLVEGDFLYYTSTRHNTDFVRSMEAYRGMDASVFGEPIPQHPRLWNGFRHFEGSPFNGRLVVLIDARCFSTTDNLCAFLQDTRSETRFVGAPTGGGTGEPMTITTLGNCGVAVQFCVSRIHSPRGRLIEGTGTSPDVLVNPAFEDLIQRRDAAFEAAKSQLLNW